MLPEGSLKETHILAVFYYIPYTINFTFILKKDIPDQQATFPIYLINPIFHTLAKPHAPSTQLTC